MTEPTTSAGPGHGVVPAAEDEVVGICRDLIRIDTSNYGDGSGPGERTAAEYVAALLAEVGLDDRDRRVRAGPRQRRHPDRRGRTPTGPRSSLHGHLDVVPAQAADWQVDPFAGEVADGCSGDAARST